YCPVTEHAANNLLVHSPCSDFDFIFTEQINDNIVIVSCIKSNVSISTRMGYSPYNIQCFISIKRSDFNCMDIRDFRKPFPKFKAEFSASNSWLQIEAEYRNCLGDFF